MVWHANAAEKLRNSRRTQKQSQSHFFTSLVKRCTAMNSFGKRVLSEVNIGGGTCIEKKSPHKRKYHKYRRMKIPLLVSHCFLIANHISVNVLCIYHYSLSTVIICCYC